MSSSSLRVAADVIVVLHVTFIVFVMLGGLLLRRWPWLKHATELGNFTRIRPKISHDTNLRAL